MPPPKKTKSEVLSTSKKRRHVIDIQIGKLAKTNEDWQKQMKIGNFF
jgi:hypothetical protein